MQRHISAPAEQPSLGPTVTDFTFRRFGATSYGGGRGNADELLFNNACGTPTSAGNWAISLRPSLEDPSPAGRPNLAVRMPCTA